MKKHYFTFATVILGLVAFLALLGWAGEIDYTDQCILHMSYDEYDSIKASLKRTYGHEPSERDIAHWWEEHQK